MGVQLVPFHSSTSDSGGENSLAYVRPAAKHAIVTEATWQLTAWSSVSAAPPGGGTATMDHVEPFQVSLNAVVAEDESPKPTATQSVALKQLTPFSRDWSAPLGFGLAMTVHTLLVAVHCSTVVTRSGTKLEDGTWLHPTAKQAVVLGHDTAVRTVELAPDRSGLATTLQVVFFDAVVIFSTSDTESLEVSSVVPTAVQAVAVGHEMALSCG